MHDVCSESMQSMDNVEYNILYSHIGILQIYLYIIISYAFYIGTLNSKYIWVYNKI